MAVVIAMSHVFLSYTTRDRMLNEELLAQLASALTPLGPVYVDLLHNEAVDRQRHVISMLQSMKYFVLCITPSIANSKWVRLEVEYAIYRACPIFMVDVEQWLGATLGVSRVTSSRAFQALGLRPLGYSYRL